MLKSLMKEKSTNEGMKVNRDNMKRRSDDNLLNVDSAHGARRGSAKNTPPPQKKSHQ
jgi:hypothetical protein